VVVRMALTNRKIWKNAKKNGDNDWNRRNLMHFQTAASSLVAELNLGGGSALFFSGFYFPNAIRGPLAESDLPWFWMVTFRILARPTFISCIILFPEAFFLFFARYALQITVSRCGRGSRTIMKNIEWRWNRKLMKSLITTMLPRNCNVAVGVAVLLHL
jgi:hypothetical protein